MNNKKANEYLQHFQRMASGGEVYNIGICYICLNQMPEARAIIEESLNAFIEQPRLWILMERPSLLVDIWILTGREDLYSEVAKQVDSFSDKKGKELPLTGYSYALLELLFPWREDISKYIDKLLKRPNYKYYYSIGQGLLAISQRNEIAFAQSLQALLKAHDGMAKHGLLRESPEGLLCLPAMSLIYTAWKNNILVNFDNQYISIEYLNYIKAR